MTTSLHELTLMVTQHPIDLSPFEDAVESWIITQRQARDSGVLPASMQEECEENISQGHALLSLIQLSKPQSKETP